MADIVLQKSVAELIDDKAMSSSLSWTAGGASDSVTWTGITIDREGFSNGSLARNIDAVVFYDATLGSGQTLALYWDLQTSPNSAIAGSWTDYATEAATVVATGPSGGGRVVGVARMVIPSAERPTGTPGTGLGNAQRYLRLNVVPHLSRTGTDTAVIAAVGIFAGFDQLPAPQV